MTVGIDHARNDGFAGDVDHARAGAAQRRRFLIAADKDNAVAANGYCLGARQGGVGRVDASVEKNEVGLLCLGSRSDDDRGAQSCERVLQVILLSGNWRIKLRQVNPL
jgi:hypothetical protein